jgi:hypothetical protein
MKAAPAQAEAKCTLQSLLGIHWKAAVPDSAIRLQVNQQALHHSKSLLELALRWRSGLVYDLHLQQPVASPSASVDKCSGPDLSGGWQSCTAVAYSSSKDCSDAAQPGYHACQTQAHCCFEVKAGSGCLSRTAAHVRTYAGWRQVALLLGMDPSQPGAGRVATKQHPERV